MTIKDKPLSMSPREWITKKLSLDLVVSEKIIEAVIAHQFDSALSATYKDNDSVEISGFGTFHFNVGKAEKVLNNYKLTKNAYLKKLESNITDKERNNYNSRIETVDNEIGFLEYKLNKERNEAN
jgi:nucleoid DNA-binding protein